MEIVIPFMIHPAEYVFQTDDAVLSVFNKMTRINESKRLTKNISCKYEYKFNGRKCNSN